MKIWKNGNLKKDLYLTLKRKLGCKVCLKSFMKYLNFDRAINKKKKKT